MTSWRIFFAVAWSGMVEGKWQVHCHQYDRRAFATHRQGCTATRPRCLQQPSRLNPALCTFFPSMIQQNNHRLHSDVHPLPISREKITDDPEEWAVWVGHRKVHPILLTCQLDIIQQTLLARNSPTSSQSTNVWFRRQSTLSRQPTSSHSTGF